MNVLSRRSFNVDFVCECVSVCVCVRVCVCVYVCAMIQEVKPQRVKRITNINVTIVSNNVIVSEFQSSHPGIRLNVNAVMLTSIRTYRGLLSDSWLGRMISSLLTHPFHNAWLNKSATFIYLLNCSFSVATSPVLWNVPTYNSSMIVPKPILTLQWIIRSLYHNNSSLSLSETLKGLKKFYRMTWNFLRIFLCYLFRQD